MVITPMKKCSQCGNTYPDPFQFCPVDGGRLDEAEFDVAGDEVVEGSGGEGTGTWPGVKAPVVPEHEPASITVKSLVAGIVILVLVGGAAFATVFLYQYWKPKYGSLVIKTTPPGASIWLDGQQRGVSPLTITDLRSGGHQIKATREGYKDLLQQVEIMPYATENMHWPLEPLVPHLSNEQLAEVESWRKKLESAQKENILLPPPDDYNVLFFANKILAIDPANSFAIDAKTRLAETLRQIAGVAYAREDWLEAEKQYKNLALLFPDDIAINERLADISAKIDASVKDREKQIDDWKSRAEAALKAGTLVPPEKDNALDALKNILRLDKKNEYARTTMARVKEMLQNRGDTKIAAGDYPGARADFRLALQYFPEDQYSKSRITAVDAKLAEATQLEQQRLQHTQEEQQSKLRVAALRQSALAAYRSGAYSKAISEWQEYAKLEPNSDEAYFYIGASNLEQKQFDTAILNFEKAVSLNPGNGLAHLNLGILYDRHRNDLKAAAEHLRKAKDLGGVEKYGPDRLQSMIQDIQDRTQLLAMQKTPFAAEHKHMFSSCRGTLRVTEEGLEYKTNEADHSFFESYAGLRSLSIDGDEISIRTRNNKKYNFHLVNGGDGAKLRRLAAPHTQITE
jgi:tetratricopeptide (TPR) repeat protein